MYLGPVGDQIHLDGQGRVPRFLPGLEVFNCSLSEPSPAALLSQCNRPLSRSTLEPRSFAIRYRRPLSRSVNPIVGPWARVAR